jgi:hypothetical protein
MPKVEDEGLLDGTGLEAAGGSFHGSGLTLPQQLNLMAQRM